MEGMEIISRLISYHGPWLVPWHGLVMAQMWLQHLLSLAGGSPPTPAGVPGSPYLKSLLHNIHVQLSPGPNGYLTQSTVSNDCFGPFISPFLECGNFPVNVHPMSRHSCWCRMDIFYVTQKQTFCPRYWFSRLSQPYCFIWWWGEP